MYDNFFHIDSDMINSKGEAFLEREMPAGAGISRSFLIPPLTRRVGKGSGGVGDLRYFILITNWEPLKTSMCVISRTHTRNIERYKIFDYIILWVRCHDK